MSTVRVLKRFMKVFKIHFSYTCKKFENFLLMWNTSVSDHCCHHCDSVVYKADSVIDTIQHNDECQTVESSICRILPGLCAKLLCITYTMSMLEGYDKATEETEFSYKRCCNDETGTFYF